MISLSSLFLVAVAAAQIAVPPLKARVTDLTGTLSAQQRSALEQTLAEFERRKGAQVAVLMVPSTQPETVEQYAVRVEESWKLGRKGVEDSVLLVVAKNDRKLHIEVGYGLEGVLPDAIAKRIIEDDITPRFKQGDFYSGVRAGTDRIMRVIEGEKLPPPRARAEARGASPDVSQWLFITFFIAVVAGPIFHRLFGRVLGPGILGGGIGAFAWFITGFALIAALTGVIAFVITFLAGLGRASGWSGSGGGWSSGGGFSSGGGGFSSDSGGGFSGGGGSSGGGGASGSW
ncbi:MAG TPA: YgcG family protein [Burkholderiales bacterium]|nr:YgcG family protein [Burkholderiales bacterium]